MRMVCWVLSFMLLFSSYAYAIAPINSHTIKQAQQYGNARVKDSLQDFFQPWTAYEEKAEILNESTERANLYTMFLLLAIDAREKAMHDKPLQQADTDIIIADFSGTLCFSVKLFGKDEDFVNHTTAVLKQGKKTIKPVQALFPPQAERCTWLPGKLFTAQGYFYFDEQEVDLSQPVLLIVKADDKKTRNFNFDLSKIR